MTKAGGRHDRDAMDCIPLFGPVLRVFGRPTPVHDEVVVRVVLDNACAAVAVGDEVSPSGSTRCRSAGQTCSARDRARQAALCCEPVFRRM